MLNLDTVNLDTVNLDTLNLDTDTVLILLTYYYITTGN